MWPGRGQATLRWGAPGPVLPGSGGADGVAARQRAAAPRFADAGIARLLAAPDGVPEAAAAGAAAAHRLGATAEFAAGLGLGGFNPLVLMQLAEESQEPAFGDVVDLAEGRRLCEFEGAVWYGAGSTLARLRPDGSTESVHDVGSPILQVSGPLLRTRRGLQWARPAGTGGPVIEGATMDLDSQVDTKRAALLTDTHVAVWDASAGVATWEAPVRFDDPGHWGRARWADAHTLLWTTRRAVMRLDTRAPPPRADAPPAPVYSAVERFALNCDVHVDTSGASAYVLTTDQLAWLDLRYNREVLGWQHQLSGDDDSLSITAGPLDGGHNLVVGSQARPFNVVFTLGRQAGMPVSLRDPYIIEYWPNTTVQSQLLVPSEDGGQHLYMAERDGGLLRQTWKPWRDGGDGGDGSASDAGWATEPPVTVCEPVGWGREQVDFDLTAAAPPSSVLRMDNMYRWIFELQRPPLATGAPVPPEVSVLRYLGFRTARELRDHCERMWLDPLAESARARFEAPRQAAIDKIVADMEAARSAADGGAAPASPVLKAGGLGAAMAAAWDQPAAEFLEADEALAFARSRFELQPGWSPGVPTFAGVPEAGAFDDISFSQPLAPAAREASDPAPRAAPRGRNKAPKPVRAAKTASTAAAAPRSAPEPAAAMFSSQPVDSGVRRDALAGISMSQGAPPRRARKPKKKKRDGFG